MSTTSAAVAQSRAALEAAEAAQRDEHRAKLIAQLAKVREELPTETENLEQLGKQIMIAQADLDSVRRQLVAYDDAIGLSALRCPAVAVYLPNDPEVRAWQNAHDHLEATRAQLLRERAALPNCELLRIDAVNLHRRVQELRWAEAGLLYALNETRTPENPVGGVFAPR